MLMAGLANWEKLVKTTGMPLVLRRVGGCGAASGDDKVERGIGAGQSLCIIGQNGSVIVRPQRADDREVLRRGITGLRQTGDECLDLLVMLAVIRAAVQDSNRRHCNLLLWHGDNSLSPSHQVKMNASSFPIRRRTSD
jgi:hypothetical protein